MKKLVILFLSVWLISCGFISAQLEINSVSGNLGYDNQIIISGRDFGVKENADPLKWDDFEEGHANTLLKDIEESFGWSVRQMLQMRRLSQLMIIKETTIVRLI